jgi:glycosyltransferase involved in cell wall biosynthesis
MRWRPMMPSGGPSLPGRPRVRLLALLAARNEMRYLPGYLANVGAQVDGIVALDDASTDATAEFLESREEVLEVVRVSRNGSSWDEVGNYRRLVRAAMTHRPDWLVSIDADERLECEFRPRAERVIRRGRAMGLSAYAVRMRSLWDSPKQYRVDGLWNTRFVARLFKARSDHKFDERELHSVKAPMQARLVRGFALADLEVYHLRMIRREDREARRRKYELLDPDALWQPKLGYGHLTNEEGKRLRPIPRRRRYVE